MTQLPQPPKEFNTEWLAQNNRVIEGRLRGLTNLEQRVYTAEQLLAGDLTAIGALTGTGYIKRIADNAWSISATIPNTDIAGLGTFATQNFATPPAIGGTTPNTGAFTTLSATGAFSCNGSATLGDSFNDSHTVNGALTQRSTAGTVATFGRAGSNGAFFGLTDASGNFVYFGETNGLFEIQTPGSGYSTKFSITSAGLCTAHNDFAVLGNATLGDAATDTVDVKGRIFGSNIHNNANGLAGASYIGSSTFTPSGTGMSNVSTITPAKAQLMRVGNVVTVSGTVDVGPTAGAATTTFRLTLGVASNLAALSDLAGSAAFIAGSTHGPVIVYADTANDQAFFSFTSASTSTHSITYQFTYEVL